MHVELEEKAKWRCFLYGSSEEILEACILGLNKRTETERGRWQEKDGKRWEKGKGDFGKTWSLSLSLSSRITLYTQN